MEFLRRRFLGIRLSDALTKPPTCSVDVVASSPTLSFRSFSFEHPRALVPVACYVERRKAICKRAFTFVQVS